MHENGRLYFEGKCRKGRACKHEKRSCGNQDRGSRRGRITGTAGAQTQPWTVDARANRPFRPVSHQLYLSPVFPTIPMCPLEADQQAEAPPANTSQTPRISLAVISLYHSLWALSIKSRKKPAQQPVPGRCAYAYRLPGWRGMYVPMGPVFISPWSTASVPRR